MRSRLAVLPAAALLVTACGGGDAGGDSAPPPAGALLDLRSDTYLGLDATGSGPAVDGVRVTSTGEPVVVSTAESGGDPLLTRGTDLATGVPLADFSGSGVVTAFTVAPDGTAVLFGSAGLESTRRGTVVARVAPDGTQQGVQLQLPESVAFAPPESIGFSTDATRVAAATLTRDTSQGFPVYPGTLDVVLADTTTGATVGAASLPVVEPAADVPGEDPPLAVRWVAVTADGGVAVSTVDQADVGQVLWFDAALAPVGTTPDVPTGVATPTADGDVLVATSDEAGTLLRLRPGAAAAEPVAELPDDWFRTTGIAVDEERAYLTGAVNTGGDGFPESVLSVELATGSLTDPVRLCDEGSLGQPAINGDALLVSGTCNDEGLLQERVYLLGPAA